jgi:competence protein ComEA
VRGWLLNGALPVGVALLTGILATFLTSGHQPSSAIEIRPAELQPTPTAVIFVHVDGAVTAPGVYALAAGGRIFEAIDAAGGTTGDADPSGLNLAAKVADGQKLVVPIKRVPGAEIESLGGSQPPVSQTQPSSATAPTIGINSASQRVLESLPGIGPVTATKIIQRRTASGPFVRIEQLREERLVNASTYERIRNLISVD